MQLKEYKVYDLNHRCEELDGQNSIVIAVSNDKEITIIDLQNSFRNTLKFDARVYGVSCLESKEIISLIDSKTGNLVIADFQGQVLFSEYSPKSETQSQNSFITTYFDEKYLWSIAALSYSKVEIQLRQTDNFSIINKYELEDPFGDSNFDFFPTNNSNQVALLLGAGQDGTEILWLENKNEKILCRESLLPEISLPPPSFSPKGDEFLVLDDYENILYRYLYPQIEEAGSCQWETDEDTYWFDLYYSHLNEDYAVTMLNEKRVFLLEIKEMKIVDEIIIENHEPMPVPHYYPTLMQENHLCTDLS
ncbi:MAG: hypothetical protein HC846_03915, partial [Blastocatellia bacterium]|nr:hypothetical protein [Blastocatellia bacterium]